MESKYSASSPAVADGKIYFGIQNSLYSFDASTGEQIWSYRTGGLIQSSPAISDGLLFIGSDDGILYAIGTPSILTFDAGIWNNVAYHVEVQSNSTVTDFSFNPSLKQIRFNINGQSGTSGYCNVTIPRNLLQGPYTINLNDSENITTEEKSIDTYTFLYFTCTHNSNTIEIAGTESIPEFPSSLIISSILITTMFIVYLKKKNYLKN